MAVADVVQGPWAVMHSTSATAAGTETNLGTTPLEGFSLDGNEAIVFLKTQQNGATPIKAFDGGVEAEVKIRLQEWVFDTIDKVLGGLLVKQSSAGGADRFQRRTTAGTVLTPFVLILRPKPLNVTPTRTYDVVLHSAVLKDLGLTMDLAEEGCPWDLTFAAMPDPSTGVIYSVGDPTFIAV